MTYEECLEYIHNVSWLGSKPGLSRIEELCRLIGNPQKELRFIHVAGTNGKGSTSAMLSAILKEAGMKVGLFTSPYVFRFNERMNINGSEISNEELSETVEYVMPYAESMEDHPTEFELITAVGFEYFKRNNCDVVVLEAGLGGRLDSTNIIDSSLLSIITGIALDHTEFLGDTVEKIAAEKAGILKSGCPVVVGNCSSGAKEVIKGKANEVGCKVYEVDYSRLSDIKLSLEGATFCVEGYKNPFSIALCGAYQPENAMIAITAAEVLGIEQNCVRNALKTVLWRARFELLSKDPIVIYDGGHNPQGVSAAVRSVKEIYGKKVNILTGVMADKDYEDMSDMISEIADRVFCVTPDNPRSLPADKYAEVFTNNGVCAKPFNTIDGAVEEAIKDSRERGIPLIGLGSLYMYHDFVEALRKVK